MSQKVSSEFPHDLSVNILSRLPLKSLVRFRCVQKSWSDLLENPHFMRIYCRNLTYEYDDSSLLLKHKIPSTRCANHLESRLSLLSGEKYEKMVELDWPPPLRRPGDVMIIGPCINGIICLSQGDKLVLWNPAIEEFKVIPFCLDDIPCVGYLPSIFGFGYDHVKEDYKVIQFVSCIVDLEEVMTKDWPVTPDPFWQIYSLKGDCWKKIDHLCISLYSLELHDYSVYLNGVYHFWGLGSPIDSDRQEELLVSLGMSSEVSITTPMPINLVNVVEKRLVVFNGSIAMISKLKENCFDISILGEVGVKESWIKIFTIGPLPCIMHPIGIGNKGEILFRKDDDDELTWFDFNTQMIVEIDIERVRSCQTVIYKENFHPIEGFNKE